MIEVLHWNSANRNLLPGFRKLCCYSVCARWACFLLAKQYSENKEKDIFLLSHFKS